MYKFDFCENLNPHRVRLETIPMPDLSERRPELCSGSRIDQDEMWPKCAPIETHCRSDKS